MDEEPTLKGDLVNRLGQQSETSGFKLKGTLLKEQSTPEIGRIDWENEEGERVFVKTVKQRDSGDVFEVGLPHKSELGSEPQIVVKLTQINLEEGVPPKTVTLELKDFVSKLKEERSPWSIDTLEKSE